MATLADRRAHLRRPLRDRLDVVHPRQRGRRPDLRGLGRRPPAAARRGCTTRARPASSRPPSASACSRRAARFTVAERLAAWQPEPLPQRPGALAVLVIGMATCWSIVQPLRAENAHDAVREPARRGEYDGGRRHRDDRPEAQPAVRGALVRARLRARRAGRPQGRRCSRSSRRSRRSRPTRSRGGASAATSFAAQRRQGRAAGVPGRLLPRPAVAGRQSDVLEASRAAAAAP